MENKISNLVIQSGGTPATNPFTVDSSCRRICIIGNNGSGKSSLMRQIRVCNNSLQMSIISAHKNLSISQGVHRGTERSELQANKDHFRSNRGGGSTQPSDNNFIQDDFNHNLELLARSYAESATKVLKALKEHKTPEDLTTKLDTITQAWNQIFVDKKMVYIEETGQLMVKTKSGRGTGIVTYEIEKLSDGERSALYILIKVAMAAKNTIIIIDEPETYLNVALIQELTDSCESMREDCTFIYFTHSLEFATSRVYMPLFWIKSFSHPSTWEIEPIKPEYDIPKELITRIVGTKKRQALFVESNQAGDTALYRKLYPSSTVIPVGGCDRVIRYTKSFNDEAVGSLRRFDKECSGLIDRDLRTDDEVKQLGESKVFVLPVAIYENLFFMRDIVKYVLEHLGIEKGEIDGKLNGLTECISGTAGDIGSNKKLLIGYIEKQFREELSAFSSSPESDSSFTFKFDDVAYKRHISTLKDQPYDEILKRHNPKSLKGCCSPLGRKWEQWYEQVLNIFNTDKRDDFRQLFFKNGMPKIE